MTKTEQQIWDLVHEWCNEQSCEIPDFNRRVLMERILALRQPLVSGSFLCALAGEKRCDTQCFTCSEDQKCDELNRKNLR